MKSLIELKGNWTDTKKKLKKKFDSLGENDLLLVKGRQDEMLGRLQVKLGKTKEDILKIIAEL
ncbi:MAG: general stress protein CsbD [Bacteroidota bacterium]|nr:general stress protein CsbD [Bacteroidota bacterium]